MPICIFCEEARLVDEQLDLRFFSGTALRWTETRCTACGEYQDVSSDELEWLQAAAPDNARAAARLAELRRETWASRRLVETARQCVASGDFGHAEVCCRLALALWEQTQPDDPEVVRVLEAYAELFAARREASIVRALRRRAEEIHQRANPTLEPSLRRLRRFSQQRLHIAAVDGPLWPEALPDQLGLFEPDRMPDEHRNAGDAASGERRVRGSCPLCGVGNACRCGVARPVPGAPARQRVDGGADRVTRDSPEQEEEQREAA